MSQLSSLELTERQQYWLDHLRACDRSGQTTIDYAREHGISVRAMYSARKALVKKGTVSPLTSSRFQQVQLVPNRAPDGSQWQVQLPNGTAVMFNGSVDAPTPSLVLSTVAKLS